jgi:hypothetical protein
MWCSIRMLEARERNEEPEEARAVCRPCGHRRRGSHALQLVSVGSIRMRRRGRVGKGQKSRERSPIWGRPTRVSVHARPESLTRLSPSLTLLTRLGLKWYGVGEGESELGVDFLFPQLTPSCNFCQDCVLTRGTRFCSGSLLLS